MIQVLDKHFEPYLKKEDIQRQIERLANEMAMEYAGKNPVFVAVLNGSFMFASDLFKSIKFNAEICFIKLASYKGTKSSGQVVSVIGLDMMLKDRHVVVIEDIVDTGRTLTHFLPELENQQPASLRLCTLLHKPEATVFPLQLDYIGFSIPNRFVVGYGLDYDGFGRNFPEIYQLAEGVKEPAH
ncbi:MAG TPA: hypoxanthine phosphoribosyltransferase [Phnomibacter sp.]|nr:hypoxanthine phosphoribosyltransferase [Phnomibacter sp.]